MRLLLCAILTYAVMASTMYVAVKAFNPKTNSFEERFNFK